MGVPYLRRHLQPYAVGATLNHGRAIIDGPALAYHIHNLCRTDTVKVPSCDALSEVCLRWLDEVTSHGLSIEAIYFDGHLPPEKLPVRKDRLQKRTAEFKSICNRNSAGCPASLLTSPGSDADYSLCHTSLPRKHQSPPPNPFTVQTAIDTLKLSSQYGAVTHIVPGEADSFCAETARRTPDAVILTSDSDLLLYDVGGSSVIFLDDIVLSDRNTAPSCSTLSPLSLETRLRLLGTGPARGLRRFAFELVKNPNASLPQLLARCKRPVSERQYTKFDQQYHVQQSTSPPLAALNSSPLDSRLSELFLQCGSQVLCPPRQPDSLPGGAARFFLPNVLENYGRSSCFEPSSEIRRLAYSLLSSDSDGQVQGVWEFKRLHVLDGRGTYVAVLPPSDLPQATRELAAALSHVSSQIEEDSEYFWPAIALELDARYSRSEGKIGVVATLAGMAQRTSEMSATIPWDVAHFKAQVDACCYSFRILGQVLSLARFHLPPEGVDTIYNLVSRVPSLRQLPTTETILKFLSPAPAKSRMLRMLRTLEQQDFGPQESPVAVAAVNAGKRNLSHQRGGQSFSTRNPFGILLDAED